MRANELQTGAFHDRGFGQPREGGCAGCGHAAGTGQPGARRRLSGSGQRGGQGGEQESPLGELEEFQLAAELLEVSNEEELEQFLGNLLKNVARRTGGFLRSRTGRALGGILKNVAKAALPVAGGALGSVVPGFGTAVGARLGSLASQLFEAEPGELAAEAEDEEFEVARRFVRVAATSARNAGRAPRRASPQAVARASVLAAARRSAPGLARRFRRFARPAPWYWPRPIPVYYQAPVPAPASPWGAAQAPVLEPAPAGVEEPAPAGVEEPVPAGGEEPAAAQGGPAVEAAEFELGSGRNGHRRRSGRWIRRGRKLVVLGV